MAPSGRPLLRFRSDYASNPIQLHLSSRRVGAMGSARAGQLRGGANCRNHCEAARALSPSPEPMPSAAPKVPQWGSNKILYLAETERLGRIERHRRRTGALHRKRGFLEKTSHMRPT